MTLSRKEIAKLIGQVFIQKSAVNLLSTVLDTPEFFWSAPDSMQNLYKRVCEYMELDDRVEVLNNRFQVRISLTCPKLPPNLFYSCWWCPHNCAVTVAEQLQLLSLLSRL